MGINDGEMPTATSKRFAPAWASVIIRLTMAVPPSRTKSPLMKGYFFVKASTKALLF